MNIKQLSSDGKIAYLIKPILKVLQEAGGQLEGSDLRNCGNTWRSPLYHPIAGRQVNALCKGRPMCRPYSFTTTFSKMDFRGLS